MEKEQFLKIVNAIKLEAKENNNSIEKSYLNKKLEVLHLDKAQYQLVMEFLESSKIKIYDEEFTILDTELNEQEDLEEDYFSTHQSLQDEDMEQNMGQDTDQELSDDISHTNSYVQLYQEEIKELVKIKDEDMNVLYEKAINGNKEAKEKIICQYLNQVMDMAKLYEGQGVLFEDLIQEGNIGLIMGLELLGCLDSVDEIPGFLGKTIMDAMEASINNQNEEDNFEEELIRKTSEINQAVSKKKEELNRNVKISEIAELVQMSTEEINEVLTLTGTHIHNLVRDDLEQ